VSKLTTAAHDSEYRWQKGLPHYDDRAFIFVGGGITEASDPESEWVETQNKSKTMLGVL